MAEDQVKKELCSGAGATGPALAVLAKVPGPQEQATIHQNHAIPYTDAEVGGEGAPEARGHQPQVSDTAWEEDGHQGRVDGMPLRPA